MINKLNKNGQARNYLAVVMFLVGFGLISIIALLIYNSFIDGFTTAGMYTGVVASTGNSFLTALQFFDYIIVLIMIVLIIGVGVTSYKLNTAPVFFIVTLFMGALTGFVSYFMNYIFVQIVSNEAFSSVITMFPRTILICTNLHWVALACILVGSITLYAKKEKGVFVAQ